MKRGLLSLLTRAAVATSAALAIALVLGAILIKTRPVPEPIEPASSAVSAVQIEEPVETGARGGEALVERPLFWRSRRPWEPDPEPETKPAKEPKPRKNILDEARLLGTFYSGPRAGVIIKVKGERRRILLHDEIDGWQLVSLTPRRATFFGPLDTADPGEHELALEHAMVEPPPDNDTNRNDNDGDRQRESGTGP